jgi:hypothetical protein
MSLLRGNAELKWNSICDEKVEVLMRTDGIVKLSKLLIYELNTLVQKEASAHVEGNSPASVNTRYDDAGEEERENAASDLCNTDYTPPPISSLLVNTISREEHQEAHHSIRITSLEYL